MQVFDHQSYSPGLRHRSADFTAGPGRVVLTVTRGDWPDGTKVELALFEGDAPRGSCRFTGGAEKVRQPALRERVVEDVEEPARKMGTVYMTTWRPRAATLHAKVLVTGSAAVFGVEMTVEARG